MDHGEDTSMDVGEVVVELRSKMAATAREEFHAATSVDVSVVVLLMMNAS